MFCENGMPTANILCECYRQQYLNNCGRTTTGFKLQNCKKLQMDLTASLLQNGDDIKEKEEVHSVIVKSSDSKFHEFTYHPRSRKLNFSLIELV